MKKISAVALMTMGLAASGMAAEFKGFVQDQKCSEMCIRDRRYIVHTSKARSHCACSVSAIQTRHLTLDVIHSPDESDPAHALITGIPDRTKGQVELAQAERFAEMLAERASEYSFARHDVDPLYPAVG